MKLAPSEIAFFEARGYFPAGRILSVEELEELRHHYDQILSSDELRQRMAEFAQGTGRSILQYLNVFLINPFFERLLYKPELLDIAESLIGPNLRLYHDQLIYKPPQRGDDFPWHQDDIYWKLEPPASVSAWITLDEATIDNGCMHFIPGSHRQGLLPHRDHVPGKRESLLEAEAVDGARAVAVELSAGHAVFHHCRTLHATPPNRTSTPRRAYVIHYMTSHVDPHWEAPHPVLRGAA